MWCFAQLGTICTISKTWKTLLHGCFHVFWIVQMVPNRVTHHIWQPSHMQSCKCMYECSLVGGSGRKMIPFLPLLSCESSVSVKENTYRKKICKFCNGFADVSSKLIFLFPMFIFHPPENIKKPKVFLCFQEDQKGTLGRNG